MTPFTTTHITSSQAPAPTMLHTTALPMDAQLHASASTTLAQLIEDYSAVLDDADPVSDLELARSPSRRRGGTIDTFEYPAFMKRSQLPPTLLTNPSGQQCMEAHRAGTEKILGGSPIAAVTVSTRQTPTVISE
ncbi:hypothetical protein VMCG_10011 [Cytospora schulzeri]|uniref:Uncharacterized protein n=1 Tax=Cytospora schulzeri TaxID=448051 RepID=A0A423VI88_9PEZI|nr:hypothetical protein VMCG_10011 [Valsa malicola]